MPIMGWVFLVLAIALMAGSLFMLRDSTNMPISREKMKKIRERKAELEEEEKQERKDDW